MQEILSLAPVVPVLVVQDAKSAVPLAKALVAGGLPVVEITLRTPAALDAIRNIADEVPGAVVGAGTVLNRYQYDDAVKAGAKFIVSPGCTPNLAMAARDTGVPLLPGAITPSEVITLLEAGFKYLKFFPAEAAGGIEMLKSFASPLADAIFCPTGGIDAAKAQNYLALPNVICVGGSWIAPNDAVKAGDWGRIEELARAASGLKKAA